MNILALVMYSTVNQFPTDVCVSKLHSSRPFEGNWSTLGDCPSHVNVMAILVSPMVVFLYNQNYKKTKQNETKGQLLAETYITKWRQWLNLCPRVSCRGSWRTQKAATHLSVSREMTPSCSMRENCQCDKK